MPLTREYATPLSEGELDSFCCWDGAPNTPWAEEAENFVRAWMLGTVEHILLFRDQDALIAVSAFDRRKIEVPLVAPRANPGWHLQVVAVTLDRQGHGLFDDVILGTFAEMRQLDPERVLITGSVHRENQRSFQACARHGIDYFLPRDDHYVVVLGEVPET